jgi:hypothetical protein
VGTFDEGIPNTSTISRDTANTWSGVPTITTGTDLRFTMALAQSGEGKSNTVIVGTPFHVKSGMMESAYPQRPSR